jgi:16S rRNA (guanine966-N2)-methyltransferase
VRIIAGKAGRLAIKVPAAVTRPTTDFVRQAIFSILSGKVEEARVLDLFAGSGALGLEALSRGASSCVFVDEHRMAAKVISQNLEKARLEGGRVANAEVSSFLKGDAGSYDLIFADPPYYKHYGDRNHAQELLDHPALPPRLAPDGWLILEISAAQKSPKSEQWVLADRREYGGCAVLLYAAPSAS